MFKSIIALALFASSAFGAIQFSSAPLAIEAGKSYTFTWTSTGSGPVSILLKTGPSGNLQTVGTITSSGEGGSYQWTAPSTYAPGSYAFEIDQGTDVNYWGPVTFTGGAAASSVASSAIIPSASITSAPLSSPTPKGASLSSSSHVGLSMSGYSNSTTTSTKMSTSTKSSTSSSGSASASIVVASSNSATSLGSPIALVLGALAAMLYLQ